MSQHSAVPRRAMILAAGLGERLHPLTCRRAKPALPILNRPLIAEIARRLAAAGVRELVVNLHHQPQTVRTSLLGTLPEGVSVVFSEEQPRVLGTGGALRRARSHLEGGPFLLANGDSLSACDLEALARAHRKFSSLATLVVRPLRPGDPYRPLEADEAGRLWRIAGRPCSAQPPQPRLKQYLFTGIHLIEPELFDFFPEREVFDINHDVYPAALAAGRRVTVLPDTSAWYEIGNPSGYLSASLALLAAGGLAGAAEHLVREGIFAGSKVRGLDVATLDPPVWLGSGSSLQAGARLRRCVIGPRCEMQQGAHVEDSVLLEGARVGAGAMLRGVIADEGVEVPPAASFESRVLVRDNGSLATYDLSVEA
ncbi:MAG: NDP-sugar synthase [Acidobacteriota bacterium]